MINAVVPTVRRHWWALLVRGLLAILLGIIALVAPGIALLAFIYIFAAYVLLDGLAAVTVAFFERRFIRSWWVLLLEGIAGLVFGLLALVWPAETALILLFLVALWALLTGIMEIGFAFILPGPVAQHWGLGIAGILSFIFGLVLIIHPAAGLLGVLWLVGIYAIVFGISLSIYAFQVRAWAPES